MSSSSAVVIPPAAMSEPAAAPLPALPTATALPPVFSIRAITGPGLTTVRRYWKPFVLLQAAALLLIVGYYRVPAVNRACLALSDYRTRSGLVFSAIAAGMAGSLLPDLAKRIAQRNARVSTRDVQNLIFTYCAFAFSGVFTDLQYRLFAHLYGNGNDWITVGKKTLTDQFVTTPIYGTPYWVVVYLWRRNRYNPVKTVLQMRSPWYLRDVAPLLVTGWAYWLPMVTLVYMLPSPLQFLLFCFALAGWSILMAFVSG